MCRSGDRQQRLFRVVCIYLFFLIYMVGVVVGIGVQNPCDDIPCPALSDSNPTSDLYWDLLGYCFIFVFSGVSFGLFVIPAIVWLRAFVFSLTVAVCVRAADWPLGDVLRFCLPTVVYTMGLIYSASVAFVRSVGITKGRKLNQDDRLALKRGILLAGICWITNILLKYVV